MKLRPFSVLDVRCWRGSKTHWIIDALRGRLAKHPTERQCLVISGQHQLDQLRLAFEGTDVRIESETRNEHGRLIGVVLTAEPEETL